MVALEITGLRKRFGSIRALEDVSFTVDRGEVFGYLGPNGAGKTTTLRILAGLVRADGGEARLLGRRAGDAAGRVAVGYLPGDLALYGGMTGRAMLDRFAGFRPGRPPVLRARLLEALQLEERDLSRRAKFLSHGTRQKLGLVIAMQHDPELLLLDEPTSGLDPLVQKAFRELILERAAQGRAILFSSHVLSEVEAVCGRVAVLGAGRVLALQTIDALRERLVRRMQVRFRGTPPPELARTPGVIACEIEGQDARLQVRGDLNPLLQRLAGAGVERFVFPEPQLEDVFLGYFGREEAPP
jgi:ABC-type multidrug transport system ATPase subunit